MGMFTTAAAGVGGAAIGGVVGYLWAMKHMKDLFVSALPWSKKTSIPVTLETVAAFMESHARDVAAGRTNVVSKPSLGVLGSPAFWKQYFEAQVKAGMLDASAQGNETGPVYITPPTSAGGGDA